MNKERVEKLQNWSVESDPYKAPEIRVGYLRGERESDGKPIVTSRMVRAEGRIITTHSGSRYRLGRVHPKYRRWLRKMGLEYNPKHPIVVHRAEVGL